MNRRLVTLADGRAAAVSQQGQGPALLCLGGGPGFAAGHLGTLGGLDAHRTLVMVDLRGAGASDPPGTATWSVDDYVADLRDVHLQLALSDVDLFGHSHGGFVAATYAARFGGDVRRLILDGTPIRPRDLTPPAEGLAGFFARYDATARAYAESLEALLYAEAAEWFATHEWEVVDLEPILSQIEAPTLVITGDEDWACGADAVSRAASLMPDGRTAVIENAGHFSWVEQPEAYADAIFTFM